MNKEDFFSSRRTESCVTTWHHKQARSKLLSCHSLEKNEKGNKKPFVQARLISLNSRGTENEPGRFFHHVALNPESFCCLIAQVNTRLLGSTRLQDAGKKWINDKGKLLRALQICSSCLSLVNFKTYNAVAIWPVTGQGDENTMWPAVLYSQ